MAYASLRPFPFSNLAPAWELDARGIDPGMTEHLSDPALPAD
jgi:hypothetical protein